jgi:hypothetical protein
MTKTKKSIPLEDLKAYLRFKNITYKLLSSVVGCNIASISDKINNRNGRQFEQYEIFKLLEYLQLTNDEIRKYFFPDYLRNVS